MWTISSAFDWLVSQRIQNHSANEQLNWTRRLCLHSHSYSFLRLTFSHHSPELMLLNIYTIVTNNLFPFRIISRCLHISFLSFSISPFFTHIHTLRCELWLYFSSFNVVVFFSWQNRNPRAQIYTFISICIWSFDVKSRKQWNPSKCSCGRQELKRKKKVNQ